MNNTQINRFNMHLKVIDFLTDNAAETAAVEPIDDCRTELIDLRDKIITADGAANEDTHGTTETKDAARILMEKLTLKCCNGARAHATLTGNLQLLRKVDFTPTELAKQRDSVLHTTCRKAYTTVNPLGAALVPYLVTATDLTDWDAAITAFLLLITEPGDLKDDKVVEGMKVDVYQAEVTTLLHTRLDVYMDLFLPTNPFLVAEYKLARAIDDLGGSPTTWVHEAVVPAADAVSTPTFIAAPTKPIELKNTGTTELHFILSNAGGAIGSPVVVSAGTAFIGTLGTIGTGGDRFKISNPDVAVDGSFRITIG